MIKYNLYLLLFLLFSFTIFAQPGSKAKITAADFVGSEQPLLLDNGGYQDKLIAYSFFLRKINVSGGLISRRADSITNKTVGFRVINLPLINIISQAFDDYPEIGSNQLNRIIIESPDSARFGKINAKEMSATAYKEWKESNLYCYELKLPLNRADKVFDIMRQDIERHFAIRLKIENRWRQCMALVRTDSTDRLASQHTNGDGRALILKGGGLQLQGAKMNVLIHFLKNAYNNIPLPVVDATGYTGFIDLEIPHNIKDITALMESLSHYGLTLTPREIQIPMIVVRDIK